MTARLSLLDQQESESPWSGERSSTGLQHPDISKPQQPDCDQASRMSQNSAQVPMGIYLNDGQSYNHQGDQHVPAVIFEPPAPGGHPPRYGQQQLDPGKLGSGHETNTPSAPTSNATTESSHELIDVDPPAHEVADTKGVPDPQAAVQNAPPTTAPPLPERAAAVDPSAGITTEPRESKPLPAPHISEAEARRQKEQRSETYSIRHVNWTDISGKLRKSPVLVQNQNGPCPLLALVNALVLRASEDAQPPIVKALQNREQISLGLLIEALFDELTTRLGPDEELPDIEALSRFLTMLHTGMNVNPRLTLVWNCANRFSPCANPARNPIMQSEPSSRQVISAFMARSAFPWSMDG